MEIVYFAWLRERVGRSREEAPEGAKTVNDLIEILKGRGEEYQTAFCDLSAIKVAVDQELTDFDASLEGAREVAFFPPMTGG